MKILLETPAKGHFYVIKVNINSCGVFLAQCHFKHTCNIGSSRLQDQGKVIAQLMITYEWSDWRAMDIWWIQSVYVNPAYRRNGLFTALYNHAREECKKAGACGLRLYADIDNVKANKTVCILSATGIMLFMLYRCDVPDRVCVQYEAMGMISHYKVYEALNTDY